jgi:hypothetical protein
MTTDATEKVEAQKLWFPLSMVAALIMAIVGGTVWMNNEFDSLNVSLLLLTKEVEYIKVHINSDSTEIKVQIGKLNAESVTRRSFKDWTKLLQANNPALKVPIPGS